MGKDVLHAPAEVRKLIGLAGQNAAVDPNLSGRENLYMTGRLAHVPKKQLTSRVDELLERFGLSSVSGRTLKTYSGGMRRRLDVAASLIHHAPVLFLDEPTTGLDIQSRTELWEVIRELVEQGSTVLLTTQYLEEADQLADRIAVVDEGRVIANDTATALKRRLGMTSVEIEMADEAASQRAQVILSGFIEEQAARELNNVRFILNQGPGVLIKALGTLASEGLEPTNLLVREPTLDEVFLALTGKRPVTEPDNDESVEVA